MARHCEMRFLLLLLLLLFIQNSRNLDCNTCIQVCREEKHPKLILHRYSLTSQVLTSLLRVTPSSMPAVWVTSYEAEIICMLLITTSNAIILNAYSHFYWLSRFQRSRNNRRQLYPATNVSILHRNWHLKRPHSLLLCLSNKNSGNQDAFSLHHQLD